MCLFLQNHLQWGALQSDGSASPWPCEESYLNCVFVASEGEAEWERLIRIDFKLLPGPLMEAVFIMVIASMSPKAVMIL